MVDAVGSTSPSATAQIIRQAIQTDQQTVGSIATQSQGGGQGTASARNNAPPVPETPNHNAGLKGERPDDPNAPRGTFLDISV